MSSENAVAFDRVVAGMTPRTYFIYDPLNSLRAPSVKACHTAALKVMRERISDSNIHARGLRGSRSFW